jgi:hypothetical protein
VDEATLAMLDDRFGEIRAKAVIGILLFGAGAGVLAFFVAGSRRWLPAAAVILLLAGETWAAWSQKRLVKPLTKPQRVSVFRLLVRSGWCDFLSPLIGVIAVGFFLGPLFYKLTLAGLKWAIFPAIKRLLADYSQQLFEAVKQHHMVALPGTFGLTIADFAIAYDSKKGAGELWTDIAPEVMPYAFGFLLFVFVFRLCLPWAFSFGSDRRALLRLGRVIIAFLACETVVWIFEWFADHAFGFGGKLPAWAHVVAGGWVLAFAFMLEQSFKEP